METYPVDIDPDQLLRWIKSECEAIPSEFKIAAIRSREVRDIPLRRELHLGDTEREDLSEVTTIATLAIAPVNVREGWRLNIVVEDEIGPRVSDGDSAGEVEQQIDVGTFYKQFIRSGRGTATVTAEVEDQAAKRRLTHLLDAVECNRHSAGPSQR